MAAIERFLRYLGGSPITARAPGLILNDRSGERIAEALRPSNERNGEERAQFAESFASGNAPAHSSEKLLSGGKFVRSAATSLRPACSVEDDSDR